MNEIPPKENFPSKKHCNVGEQPVTTQSKTDPHTHECSSASAPPHNFPRVAEDALSNSVVLRNIFTMLNQRDLESCSNVSQCWRTVADPLVPSYFEIELVSQPIREYFPETRVIYMLKEKTRFRCYSLKRFTRYELDFKEAREKLTNALLTHKVSISLTLGYCFKSEEDTLNNFLSEFGPSVVSLASEGGNIFHIKTFYLSWLKRLPNLKKLNCSNLPLEQDKDDNFDPDQHKLVKLVKISGMEDLKFQPMLTLLKMAPNLKEISNVCIVWVHMIAAGGWGSLLKSLYMTELNDIDDGRNNVKTIFETLAQLQPKLTSFTVPQTHMISTLFVDESVLSYLRSLMFTTLQSSSQSLKSLGLQSAIESRIQPLPILNGLNTLEFHNIDTWESTQFFFRSMEISLEEMFPNVREVCIWDFLNDEGVNHYFPENIIIPWGSQIRVLKLESVEARTLPLLQKRFPSLQKLQISARNSEISELLPQLAQSWPELSSLAIDLWYGYFPNPNRSNSGCNNRSCDCKSNNNRGLVILDSAFTGLPEETVNKLLDPTLRTNFTQDEIQGFKDGSPISQLKELKELKIIYGDHRVEGETLGKLTVLTQVAIEFGFQLLPQLTVTFKMQPLYNYFACKEIATALQPLLAESNNIQIY